MIISFIPLSPISRSVFADNSLQLQPLVVRSSHTSETDVVSLDLQDLIESALQHNPSLLVIKQQQVQRQGQLTQARSGYLPQLRVASEYKYIERDDRVANLDQDSEEIQKEEGNVLSGSATISQLLYDFGKTTGSINVGKANLQAIEDKLFRQGQDIVLQTKEAYYDVLEKKRLINVAAQAVDNYKQHLKRAKAYFAVGSRTQIDVIDAEIELSNANLKLIRAKYNLEVAKVNLVQVLGTQPNRGQYVIEEIPGLNLENLLETMPSLPQSLDALVKLAHKKRRDIHQLQVLIKAAGADVARLKGNYWPTLNARASVDEYDTSLSRYDDSWEVGVDLSWELFSGLRTKGAVVEARGKMREKEALLLELELSLATEVTENFIRADENRVSVSIALQTLELAKKNLFLAEKRYEAGRNDMIEFNNAQFNLTKSQSELVSTYFGYLSSLARLEFAVGETLN